MYFHIIYTIYIRTIVTFVYFVYIIICTTSIIAISIVAIIIIAIFIIDIKNYTLKQRDTSLSLLATHVTSLHVIIRSSPLLPFLYPGTVPSEMSLLTTLVTPPVLVLVVSGTRPLTHWSLVLVPRILDLIPIGVSMGSWGRVPLRSSKLSSTYMVARSSLFPRTIPIS